MEGRLEHELEVGVPADVVWETYRGLKLGKLVPELLPHVLQKVELVEGDGEVGTVLNVVFPPGTPGFTSYKEKFTKIDDEKRVKEAEACEGGFLDLGFSLYRVTFEIIEVNASSSIIKSVIEYKVENEANASIVSTQAVELISEAVGKYLGVSFQLSSSLLFDSLTILLFVDPLAFCLNNRSLGDSAHYRTHLPCQTCVAQSLPGQWEMLELDCADDG